MSQRAAPGARQAISLAICALIAISGWITRGNWWPATVRQIAAIQNQLMGAGPSPLDHNSAREEAHAGGHSGTEVHDHLEHEDANLIELSPQARRSIGLTTGSIEIGQFVRTVSIPGIIVERPGRTRTRVVAPLTGIVTQVRVIKGEAVEPGRPLFELRLTHEDLLQAQVEFLRITEELDVVDRELERLRPIVEKGALPQKALLERQYDQQKLRGALRAQRESLLLHGLSSEQVDEVQESRSLRSRLTIVAPEVPVPPSSEPHGSPQPHSDSSGVVVEDLNIEVGRLVTAGDLLLSLSDYSDLYVEGNAFEQDTQLVADALREHSPITAVVESHSPAGIQVPNLKILYLSDQIDVATRTLHFYLDLSNRLVRDETINGRRFINWQFKPGQRTQLQVPIEKWPDRIILPPSALVQDGAESYVFQENGNQFFRRPVQVEYRDLHSAVIAQDGSLFPGDVVALTGAAQLQIALKNKAGSAIDPHAGHHH